MTNDKRVQHTIDLIAFTGKFSIITPKHSKGEIINGVETTLMTIDDEAETCKGGCRIVTLPQHRYVGKWNVGGKHDRGLKDIQENWVSLSDVLKSLKIEENHKAYTSWNTNELKQLIQRAAFAQKEKEQVKLWRHAH